MPLRDPRLLQIAVLAGLLTVQMTVLDFGASPAQAATTIAATLLTQGVAAMALQRAWDWRSPLITGLSLSLLLRSHDPAVWLMAGVLGIGSKVLVRVGGKHVFNPACFAIVLLVLSGQAWVSPGQWGALSWWALLLGGGGALVLGRARRVETAAAFLLTYVGLLLLRCLRLGDPFAIPWHQMQSGALLVFALFMISDPRTTPQARVPRVLFAATVAILAYQFQFGWQVREGFFDALFLAAPLVPLLDRYSRPITVQESATCGPSPVPERAASPAWRFSPLRR